MMNFQYADTVFLNGTVVTVDQSDFITNAIAIKKNKIIAVGSKSDVEKHIHQDTKIIDLAGRTLLPGFNESHIHFLYLCLLHAGVIVSVKDAKNIHEIREILRSALKDKKPNEWVYLSGYDQNKLEEKRHLTHEDLDDISPKNPVQCQRVCCHMSVFNQYAMDSVGVSEDTLFRNPHEVARDVKGKLTGLFKEGAQTKVLASLKVTKAECQRAFKEGEKLMHQLGITSIQDMGEGVDNFGRNVFQNEVLAGKIKLRAYMSFNGLSSREEGLKAARHLLKLGPHSGIGNEWYKMGPMKLLLDGSTSGPSCFMKERYCHNSAIKGIQNFPEQQEVNELFRDAHKQGFQITVHAVGDAAVEQVLEAYEYVNKVEPINRARFRIEHSGFTSQENARRMKRLGVMVTSNPAFLTVNGKDYNKYYGDRTEMMFPHKTYAEIGVPEAFGSDAPVVNPNPMLSIYGAVARKDILHNEVCGLSQKMDVLYAIRSLTYNGAYASFEETIKGSLEVGKLADIIVLSQDILSCPAEEIKDITVDLTMINGEIVYKKDK